jgi:hypothetical protein
VAALRPAPTLYSETKSEMYDAPNLKRQVFGSKCLVALTNILTVTGSLRNDTNKSISQLQTIRVLKLRNFLTYKFRTRGRKNCNLTSTNQLCLDRPTLGFTHVHNLDLPDNEMLSQGHEFFTELTQFQTFSYANSVNVSFQWCQLVPRFGDICSLANTKQNVFGREFKFCTPSTHVSRCRFVLTPTPHGTSALSHPSLTR